MLVHTVRHQQLLVVMETLGNYAGRPRLDGQDTSITPQPDGLYGAWRTQGLNCDS
jgi:hypothetical protein